jgi:single-strand DNA-binding protein
MGNLNTVVMSGRLTRDPEWRDVGDDGVCGISIAQNFRKKQGDSWVDGPPQFFDWAVWRGLGKWCRENLHKGDLVVVKGRAQYRTWDQDGAKRSAINFVADDIEMSASNGGAKREKAASSSGGEGAPAQTGLDDDGEIPFVNRDDLATGERLAWSV